MPTLAFDSSGMVRRYDNNEPGHQTVMAVCADPSNTIVASRLMRLEVYSAIQRKRFERRITPQQAESRWALFLYHEAEQYLIVDVDHVVFRRAESLLRRHHPLRAADAIHVATALTLLTAQPTLDLVFVTADRRQADAALAEGLAVQFVA